MEHQLVKDAVPKGCHPLPPMLAPPTFPKKFPGPRYKEPTTTVPPGFVGQIRT